MFLPGNYRINVLCVEHCGEKRLLGPSEGNQVRRVCRNPPSSAASKLNMKIRLLCPGAQSGFSFCSAAFFQRRRGGHKEVFVAGVGVVRRVEAGCWKVKDRLFPSDQGLEVVSRFNTDSPLKRPNESLFIISLC